MYDLYNNILRYSGNYLSITTYYFFCQKYSHKIMFVTQVYWVHQSCNEFQKHGKVLKTNIRAITFWISLLPFTISRQQFSKKHLATTLFLITFVWNEIALWNKRCLHFCLTVCHYKIVFFIVFLRVDIYIVNKNLDTV